MDMHKRLIATTSDVTAAERDGAIIAFWCVCPLAGAAASNAKYIVYLPENVVVVKGWLFSLWSTFAAQPNVGMAVPLIISHPIRLPAALGTLQQEGILTLHGQDIFSIQQLSHSGRAEVLQPPCFMMPRSLLHHMGFLEHAYKHDLATIKRRLVVLNSTIIFQPVSVVGDEVCAPITDASYLVQCTGDSSAHSGCDV